MDNLDKLHQYEAIEILKSYSQLKPVQYENLLLRKIDDETILEILIKMGANFKSCYFDKEDSLKILLKYKRYDLLKYVTPRNFLRNKRRNMTYLDYILKVHNFNPEINVSFYDPFNKKTSLKEVADFYIAYAEANAEKFLPTLSDDRLKYRDKDIKSKIFNGNDNFLAIMLKRAKDKQLIIDKYISKNDTKDIEILLTLDEAEKYKAKFQIKEYLSELYIDSYYKDYEDKFNELSFDNQLLIEKLSDLLSYTCSREASEAAICSYIEQLHDNPSEGIYKELNKFINILETDRDFSIKMGTDSYYQKSKNEISITNKVTSVFNHELGHALLDKLSENTNQQELDSIIERIKNNPKTIDKINTIAMVFAVLKREVLRQSYEYFDETYDFNDKSILRFINNAKNKTMEEYSKKGYSKRAIEEIINKEYTEEEYKKQYKKIQVNSLSVAIGRLKINPMLALSDIIDAVYDGEFLQLNLKNRTGGVIRPIGGHGVYYYKNRSDNKFDEIFANYMAIKKCIDDEIFKFVYSKEDDKPLDVLRYVLGNELVDYLDSFYDREILNSRKYSKGGRVI